MHLFLEGPRGVGKSTMLGEILLPYQQNLCGFTVQRLFENSLPVGYRAVVIAGKLLPVNTEYNHLMNGIFILRGEKNLSALEDTILAVERIMTNPKYKIVILDEIGGIELTSKIFMEALFRILSNGIPCVGVLKSKYNLEHTIKNLNLAKEYLKLRESLEKKITTSGTILTVDEDIKGRHELEIRRIIESFI